jgi:lipocalin
MFGMLAKGDYRVVKTDYTNYALVYSCSDIGGVAKEEAVWLLARTPTISDSLIKIMD